MESWYCPMGSTMKCLFFRRKLYMQPEILERIEQLVCEGATVVGPKPKRSHGLFNWEERDREVRDLADQIWGHCDGDQITSN